jgi:hypothetical protein
LTEGRCNGGEPPIVEVCNGIDDNCDGTTDNPGSTPFCDDADQCTTDSCNGGGCINTISVGASCDVNGACDAAGICLSPTCFDGVMNLDETDVDCEDSCLEKCALGKSCSSDVDCQCNSGLCIDT